jgi:hypothetical protein
MFARAGAAFGTAWAFLPPKRVSAALTFDIYTSGINVFQIDAGLAGDNDRRRSRVLGNVTVVPLGVTDALPHCWIMLPSST